MKLPCTVTIVNFNGRDYIADCLRAVQALEPGPEEVIVVDNASDDGSDLLVEKEFPDVRLVRLAKNEGPCPARNRGLEEAKTRLVYQLDNDVMVTPGSLGTLYAQWREGVAIIQPRAVFDDDRTRIHYDGGTFHYIGLMTLRHFYGRVQDAERGTQEVDAVISLALLVDREAVLGIGAYDPQYFILFEDHDLSYRLRARGYELWVDGGTEVYHRHGTEGISYRKGAQYPERRAFLHSRNRWILLIKNHGWRTLFFSSPGLLLFECVWFAFAIKQGMFLAYMRGKLSLLSHLIPALRGRMKRGERKVRDRSLLHAAPLTFTPLISRKGLMGQAERALNRSLSLYWRLVRRLVS